MTPTLAPPTPKQRQHPTDGSGSNRERMVHRHHLACTPKRALCGAPLPDAKKYPADTPVDCVVCEAMKRGRCPYCGVQFS